MVIDAMAMGIRTSDMNRTSDATRTSIVNIYRATVNLLRLLTDLTVDNRNITKWKRHHITPGLTKVVLIKVDLR